MTEREVRIGNNSTLYEGLLIDVKGKGNSMTAKAEYYNLTQLNLFI